MVTGATGFLGRALVKRLLSDADQVRVLVRKPAQAHELTASGAVPLIGDITDRAAVELALDGVEVVYHLAGKLLEPGQAESEYRRIHVDGTRNMLDACSELMTLERFVHCSTTGVLGTTGPTPANEEAPMRPTNVYEATKAEAETAVRKAMNGGLSAAIVRPGLVYGPGDWHLAKFFGTVLRRRFRPIGRQNVFLHPVYIDDMTEAFVRCGSAPQAAGECFHIAGPEPVSLRRLAEAIAHEGGVAPPSGHIPLSVALVAAACGDALPARIRHLAPLTRSRLDFLTHSRVYDVSKARELLGFEAATDLERGVRQTLRWYRTQSSRLPAVPSEPVALAE
ncbi:MAG TPA: NAD-dependent epimerase/dehydratase family protein [Acidimicrobiales bacterium]|nr:NAD-dependent epimerase/dehydratase family protein [Acidimicrobiales bacterium]